jgi:hypothetical protein
MHFVHRYISTYKCEDRKMAAQLVYVWRPYIIITRWLNGYRISILYISDVSCLRLSCCINAFIFYVHCLCHIACVYVFYVGHVDRVVYTKSFFHCNILFNLIKLQYNKLAISFNLIKLQYYKLAMSYAMQNRQIIMVITMNYLKTGIEPTLYKCYMRSLL